MPIDLAVLPADGWSPADDHGIRIRAVQPGDDGALLNRWFNLPHAGFWGMQGQSVDETRAFYESMQRSSHAIACIGLVDGARAFLVECYDPAADLLAGHYDVQPGDLGMHFFVGPADAPVRGFTRRVFRSIMVFMFDRLQARRIVVEPDVRNRKVHVLNREMGFVEAHEIDLPHKRAGLAFCTRAQFNLTNPRELAT
jgi:RimJ/RimL family protein N-acetyltransferase